MGEKVTRGSLGAARSAEPSEPRRSPLVLPLNPFAVLDLVLRSMVPGFGDPSPRSGGARRPAQVEPLPPPLYTRAEAAQRAGLPPEDMDRLWRALGFAELADETPGYTEADIEAVHEVAELAADGVIDIESVIGMVRPMGHLVSRLGAAQVSALSGLPDQPSGRAMTPSLAPVRPGADRLVPMLERLVIHAWRRHLVAAASAAIPIRRLDDASAPQTVGFIDITSYTTLSRRIDWTDLASLLERFEECVFDQVASFGGRVVKTLGDEVLFVAAEPAAGAEIALAVMDAARDDVRLPSVHSGLAYGPLLERAGDVFGPTVNIASRVTDLAQAGAVLVDGAFHHELGDDPRFRTQRRPRRSVRGYTLLATYRLRRADQHAKSDRRHAR